MGHSLKPRQIAVDILHRVFKTRSYADVLLHVQLSRFKMDTRDRSLVTEIVYGTLRWKGRLDAIIKRAYHGNWNQIPDRILRILESALYQILYLDRVPAYAAVNEAVTMSRNIFGSKWSNVTNALLRNIIRNPEQTDIFNDTEQEPENLSEGLSHPDWMVKRWIDRLGMESARDLCGWNNRSPVLNLRVNQIRNSVSQCLSEIRAMGFDRLEISPWLDEFFSVYPGRDLIFSPAFSRGLVSVQDVSAGLVSHLMDPQPGERILDMASAPGGKTTHLSELTRCRAEIISVDRLLHRTKRVVENTERLGLSHIYHLVADSRSLPMQGAFDKVLLDAPCSGFGVLQKKPEIRWLRTQEQLKELVRVQRDLMEAAHHRVRRGGVLVYSTCTITPEENGENVEYFLKRHPEYRIDSAVKYVSKQLVDASGALNVLPHIHHMDGGYAVRLERTA
jgi:16S rRNA (cytosine967-C5)-methyltransferase